MVMHRRLGWRLADLAGLWGVAVSQPLLGILGDNTEYFVRHRVSGSSILVFAALLSFLVPFALWALQAALWRARKAADAVHALSLSVLAGIGLAQVAKFAVGLNGVVYVAVTLVATAAVAVLWSRHGALRTWVGWLAAVPVIALALFVAASPAGRYARAGDGEVAAAALASTPVVMIMFDEFPLATIMDGSGGLDAVRYPNLARLAGDSTWYRMYSTETEETPYAVPTAVTGIRAGEGASATYADHPRSLFSVLAPSHRMHVLESVTDLCPPVACGTTPRAEAGWSRFMSGLWRLFEQRIDTTAANEFDTVADIPVVAPADTTATTSEPGSPTTVALPDRDVQQAIARLQKTALENWITGIDAAARPILAYAHVILPHQPWIFTPDGDHYANSAPEWSPTETKWQMEVGKARHGLQVQMVDGIIGKLLDHLQETGIYDDAMIVVTADHGAAFVHGHHRRYATGDYSNAVQLMSVPLFVKEPGQADGRINDANVDGADLLPIMAAGLGFEVPWSVDGRVPESDTHDPDDTKVLRFLVSPFGAADRPDPEHVVTMREFAAEVLAFGSPGTPGDPLADLYAASPHAAMRGRDVADLAAGSSPGRVTLDADIASLPGRVLLRGTLSGIERPDGGPRRWIAVSSQGRVVGLAPVEADGGFVTAVLDPDGSPVTGARFHLVESGRLLALSGGE